METVIKLNLGCNHIIKQGYVNVDKDKHKGVDYIADVAHLDKIKNNTVDEILASHILEHFSHQKTLAVLKEWQRVLKPGGIIYIGVPDFDRMVELFEKTGKELSDWIVQFLCGGQEHNGAYHYTVFNEDRLKKLLKDAGFRNAERIRSLLDTRKGECSRLVSTLDYKPVSLNIKAVK